MGPLQTLDLAGIDILVKATGNIYDDTRDAKFAAPELLLRMVAAGDLVGSQAEVSTPTTASACLARRRQYAALHRDGDRRSAVVHAELGEDLEQVRLHGRLADEQPLRDGSVG